MVNVDHYQILGVSSLASSREITAAYRKLALQYHPDRNKSPFANDMMLKINTAYGILSDPRKREEYDYSVHSANAIYRRNRPNYSSHSNNEVVSLLFKLLTLARISITNILRVLKAIIKIIQGKLT